MKTNLWHGVPWRTLLVISFLISTVWIACTPQEETTEQPMFTTNLVDESAVSSSIPLSADMPFDVDPTEKAKLDKNKEFAQVQRLFEELSWQAFVALNWPYKNGKAQPSITSTGDPKWNSWKESFEVFKQDGSRPAPWTATDEDYDFPDDVEQQIDDGCKFILYRTSKFSHRAHPDFADEIDQAFSTSIWDQNGNLVRYEVRLNEVEFDYLVDNELYNLDGQIAFSQKNGSPVVTFPSGTVEKEGAIEIKLAWKIIEEGDPFAERYYTREACVYQQDGTFTPATVGMIGMHIAMKTVSSPQWIWATFEHIDNLEVNALEKYNGVALKPSFYNPDCEICPINVVPNDTGNYVPMGEDKVFKNQIQRVLPISMATQALNQKVQSALAAANSPFQYYQLVGTQWPTQPEKAPYPVLPPSDSTTARTLPDAVVNKSGGMPTPVYLTNMIMETYFQGATQGNDYNYRIANAPAWLQVEGFPKYAENLSEDIFGTESCIGCHASASVAIGEKMVDGKRTAIFAKRYDYDSQTIGDFSWLLQQKAKFKKASK